MRSYYDLCCRKIFLCLSVRVCNLDFNSVFYRSLETDSLIVIINKAD
jgi:hypothetical protein